MRLSSGAQSRAIYVQFLIDGQAVAGTQEAEVCTSNHQVAGWFRVLLALGGNASVSAGSISRLTSATAEIRVGIATAGQPPSAATWQSLIAGPVDDIAIDMAAGTAQLTGRDFTALLIDTVSAESFPNQTASDIAQTLAQRHGLTPVVTATTTPVGRYYQDGQNIVSLYQSSSTVTEWDLLCTLAETEGYDVFVQNQSLTFAPPSAGGLPVVWQWAPGQTGRTTMTALRMERSLALARDVTVTVQSWNSRQQAVITQSAGPPPSGKAHASRYVLLRPNLTSDQALNLAMQTLTDLNRHDRTIIATLPGELALNPRSLVALQGTQTDFDRTYVVDEILRRISPQDGFVQTVRAVTPPSVQMP